MGFFDPNFSILAIVLNQDILLTDKLIDPELSP
jgi:hypothetical protein